ncbi:phospholipase A2, membrane associated-like [Gracilinanus agilis]|uniref:phospholipase A2, membrane associated-like n=1 Tax=Gracilinanus agilis TaxID=191870 RepID=UPI001CFEBF11|nr:phospholipase A2, membrane associated-like [Gracilinanus agilis]
MQKGLGNDVKFALIIAQRTDGFSQLPPDQPLIKKIFHVDASIIHPSFSAIPNLPTPRKTGAFKMKTFLLQTVLMAYGLLQVGGNLRQLEEMIETVTGMNAEESYGFYGCHCGFEGRGTPKDATDKCCAAQGCCYSKLIKEGCDPTVVKYNFTYQENNIICEPGSTCQHRTCTCDKTVAYCLQRNLATYDPKYQDIFYFKCFGNNPFC